MNADRRSGLEFRVKRRFFARRLVLLWLVFGLGRLLLRLVEFGPTDQFTAWLARNWISELLLLSILMPLVALLAVFDRFKSARYIEWRAKQ